MGALVGLGVGVGLLLIWSAFALPRRPRSTAPTSTTLGRLLGRAGLAVTVLRPGGLTDDPGTGRVTLRRSVERGSIPRDDVAALLVALLDAPRDGAVLEAVSGSTLVVEAVRSA